MYYLYELIKELEDGSLHGWYRRKWSGFVLDIDLLYYHIISIQYVFILRYKFMSLKWYNFRYIYMYKYNENSFNSLCKLEYLQVHEGIYRYAITLMNHPVSRKVLIKLDSNSTTFFQTRYLNRLDYNRISTSKKRLICGHSNKEGRFKYPIVEYNKNYSTFFREYKSIFKRFGYFFKLICKPIYFFHNLVYFDYNVKNYSLITNNFEYKFFLGYYSDFLNCTVWIYTYKFLNKRKAKYQKRKFEHLWEFFSNFNYYKRPLSHMMLFRYTKSFKKKSFVNKFMFDVSNSKHFELNINNSVNKLYLLTKFSMAHRNRKWNILQYRNTNAHIAVKSMQTLFIFPVIKYKNNKVKTKEYIKNYKISHGSLILNPYLFGYMKFLNFVNKCYYYDIITYYNILLTQKLQKYIYFILKYMFSLTQDMFYYYMDMTLLEPVNKIVWLTKTRFSGIERRFTFGKFGRKCIRKYHFWMDTNKKPYFLVKLRSGVPKYDFPPHFIQSVYELSYCSLWIIKYSELL